MLYCDAHFGINAAKYIKIIKNALNNFGAFFISCFIAFYFNS
ncbi:hypothetical protein BCB4264_A1162 [Bacillus cereus B4264]|uniref:Uncharacterized protein n=1 Tax=Bacillus cereus (strain B4264) TaxID=405532 RepID=B7HGL8_BACC4|nr:hypothetical protein BCB4264_A1162 [Bacillus cereus B4264]AVR30930.1 hypothetical protein FORC60_1037 [Bacillus cereus]QBZ24177.1 hypothetical protein FORC085_1108 [Bacillus cereus]